MSKKDFIKLADYIRGWNETSHQRFTDGQIAGLASCMRMINPAFKTQRWIDYIAGKCGPNGGKIAA